MRESERSISPFTELQITACGEKEDIGLLLDGNFNEMTLTDADTGETVRLEIGDIDKKSLILYDACDVSYEHYLINDRLVEIKRSSYDNHIERCKDTVRILFNIGKYSVVDTEGNMDTFNRYLVYDNKAYKISVEFCHKLVTGFYCETDRGHLLELLDHAVSGYERVA